MKFSVTKQSADTSLPKPVRPDILLFYKEDVVMMPTVDERKIFATSAMQLVPDASAYSLYLTPSLQNADANAEGENGSRGWTHKISGSFPGSELLITEWMTQNINAGFIAMRRHCSGVYKLFGSKHNPLFLTGTLRETPESFTYEIEFQQAQKTKVPFIWYQLDVVKPADPEISVLIPGGGTGGFTDLTDDY